MYKEVKSQRTKWLHWLTQRSQG